MDVKEHLIAARAKIAQGWCQGVSAVDSQRRAVSVHNPAAVSWCIYGALESIPGNAYLDASTLLANLNREDGGSGLLSVWNDEPSRTQEQVLALFDRAIASINIEKVV